jgi:hypothetical protein
MKGNGIPHYKLVFKYPFSLIGFQLLTSEAFVHY